MPRTLPLTPSGETLEKLRRLANALQANPKMRRAVAAAIKAMGLPEPLPPPKPRDRRETDPPQAPAD